MIRLVIGEDHAIVREGLRQIFATMPSLQVVGEAANGAEVLERLRQATFDLLLLDLNMPGISGADLIRRVKLDRANLPILILSMNNDPRIAMRMLKAGANGYITKDCESDTLLAAIGTVAAHGKYIAPAIAEQVVFNAVSTLPYPHHLLSDRELEVFYLLARGKGVNEIAAQLTISNKTVSTHKVRLMEKMQFTSITDLMRYAMRHDLLD